MNSRRRVGSETVSVYSGLSLEHAFDFGDDALMNGIKSGLQYNEQASEQELGSDNPDQSANHSDGDADLLDA